MTRYYRRRRPTRESTFKSAAIALGVAGVTFYLTRILFSKERIGPGDASRRREDGRVGSTLRADGERTT